MSYKQTRVIQKGNVTFALCGAQVLAVPCGDDAVGIDGEYWATPVKDNGVFRGYIPRKAVAAPTYDSFKIVKIYDKQSGNTYWVVGSLDEYLALCAADTPVATVVPIVIPEIPICVETGGTTEVRFTLPPIVAPNDAYKYSLAVDGVRLENSQDGGGAGYANAAAIVVHLIANHAAVGTWTSVGTDVIKLVTAADKIGVGVVGTPFNNP